MKPLPQVLCLSLPKHPPLLLSFLSPSFSPTLSPSNLCSSFHCFRSCVWPMLFQSIGLQILLDWSVLPQKLTNGYLFLIWKQTKNPFFFNKKAVTLLTDNYNMSIDIDRRRQWHPTPVLLPGKSHGRRSLGRLQSMGSQRVGHDWATSLWLFTFMHWRRKWQPTPVFLPRESQGWGSLVGCRLWGRTESDTTEAT